MKPETLRYLRESRSLTRDQLSSQLGCSAAAIVQWESGRREIPGWVEEKMLRAIPVTLPLDELYLLLDESKNTGESAQHILADAIRLWLSNQRQNPIAHTHSRTNVMPLAKVADPERPYRFEKRPTAED